MHVATPATPTATSARERPGPFAPRCPHTLITKPECHCPVCLFELIATCGPAAARADRRAA